MTVGASKETLLLLQRLGEGHHRAFVNCDGLSCIKFPTVMSVQVANFYRCTGKTHCWLTSDSSRMELIHTLGTYCTNNHVFFRMEKHTLSLR